MPVASSHGPGLGWLLSRLGLAPQTPGLTHADLDGLWEGPGSNALMAGRAPKGAFERFGKSRGLGSEHVDPGVVVGSEQVTQPFWASISLSRKRDQ